jgi:post-segregation antitoxin (ccd killing protein)
MTDRQTSDTNAFMNLMVTIPDDLARRLGADGADLSRRALEALACEEYRAGRLTKPELRQLLGYETIYELDAFLVAHGVFDPYSLADLERERQELDRLGF